MEMLPGGLPRLPYTLSLSYCSPDIYSEENIEIFNSQTNCVRENNSRIIMRLSPTFILIIISRNVSFSYTTDTDTEEEAAKQGVDTGVLNFHKYYSCYFNKYFNISSDQDNARRDKVRREASVVCQAG